MSQEITVTLGLSVQTSEMLLADGLSDMGLLFNMAGRFISKGIASIGVTATAIPLGQITSPHWAYFKNLSSTYSIKLRNGASGADLGQLYPGEPCLIPLYPSSTPYAIALTSAADLLFFIAQL